MGTGNAPVVLFNGILHLPVARRHSFAPDNRIAVYPVVPETEVPLQFPAIAQWQDIPVGEAATGKPPLVVILFQAEIVIGILSVQADKMAQVLAAEPVSQFGLYHPYFTSFVFIVGERVQVAFDIQCPSGPQGYFQS